MLLVTNHQEKNLNHFMQTAVGMGLATIIGISYPCVGLSQIPMPTPAVHDGQHDFDFNVGVWHTHIKRILDPFAGSSESVELNGTVTVRKVWGGKAELEEIEADGPKGHWEGLTLFLYNPSGISGVSRSRTARSGHCRRMSVNSRTAESY